MPGPTFAASRADGQVVCTSRMKDFTAMWNWRRLQLPGVQAVLSDPGPTVLFPVIRDLPLPRLGAFVDVQW